MASTGSRDNDDAPTVLLSDPKQGVKVRASSVLQRNAKQYGPVNALNLDNDSSCWNSEGTSDSDSSQWFMIEFPTPVSLTELRVQFQAGFAAETCRLEGRSEGDDRWQLIDEIELEDVHEIQNHVLEEAKTCMSLRLILSDFTDFYGRVTIYRLEVWGRGAE